MRAEDREAVQNLLNRWANYVGAHGGTITDGLPRQCLGAPDARCQSIEDLEIEDEKMIVRAVETAVWDLNSPQRLVIMVHYGFAREVWRFDFDGIYERALDNLFQALKNRVSVCI
jgi:hypothetical protein